MVAGPGQGDIPDRPRRAYTVEGRAEHATHHRHRPLVLHGYMGRFAGGIDSSPFRPPLGGSHSP